MSNMTAVRGLLLAGALTLSSLATAQVRISEIHYDNAGVDANEAVEISAPAGTDLSGWSLVLYNGNGGAVYNTRALSGIVAASCDTRGVAVFTYPANGIQNGDPDGIALVNNGSLVEFLSYEGTFDGVGGAADQVTSVDIGARQDGTGAAGETLQRNVSGTWALANGTFGVCNDGGSEPPTPEVVSVSVLPESATINVGGTTTLNATAFDETNSPIPGTIFTWTSGDPAVATVSPSGVVTGVSPGSAIISATAANGVGDSATVQVNEAPPPPTGEFRFNEIHYDNLNVDVGEAIEIEGPAGADVTGFSIVLYNGSNSSTYNTPQVLSGTLPASCGTRGVLAVAYPQDGIQNGSPDAIALVNGAGQVVEFLSYEGTITAVNGPAAGLTSIDIGAAQNSTPIGASLQRDSNGIWSLATSTFGACNPDSPTPVGNTIQFSGRVPSDVPLPVGYEDQLFARLVNPSNQTVPSTFTWEALTPDIATIDANGVMHALAPGAATFRATAVADGTTDTWTLPTHVAVASTTAQYANNTEFGEPQDNDPADDFIIERPQFTSSWNPNRGSPNWVAYEFDATHFGSEDRCDCFTMDPELPSSLQRLTTADYTGAGDFHGYGIDRGHLARSFDRTAGSLDNATTFLFSNIVPQASDQNQGPWAQFENELGNFARNQDREVYVLTGASGNKGTLKNEGKVVIPTHTWKVALIMPRDQGLAEVRDYRDVQVLAVIMPNEPGVRNVPWQTYLTNVDAVELLSGYDLLALLEDEVEDAVESGTQPPLGAIAGPAGGIAEGSAANFSAAGSIDPNGSISSYAWDFGDGGSAEGVSASHEYGQDGTYTVRLTVTDNDGLTDITVMTVTVVNVAPVVAAVPDGSLNVGATYTVNGSFTDPGADAWTATVVWGDGSAPEVVPLSGPDFTLTHIYTAGGSYGVSISVADDDAAGEITHTVTVEQPAPGLAAALPLIDQLVASGKISQPIGMLLKAQVIAAQIMIGRGNETGARIVVRSLLAQLDLLVRLRVVTAADVAPLRAVLTSAL